MTLICLTYDLKRLKQLLANIIRGMIQILLIMKIMWMKAHQYTYIYILYIMTCYNQKHHFTLSIFENQVIVVGEFGFMGQVIYNYMPVLLK